MACEKKICPRCGEESLTSFLYCPICSAKYDSVSENEGLRRDVSCFQYRGINDMLYKYGIL